MDRTLATITGFPLSLLTAILVTAFLFSSMPLPTQIRQGDPIKRQAQPAIDLGGIHAFEGPGSIFN